MITYFLKKAGKQHPRTDGTLKNIKYCVFSENKNRRQNSSQKVETGKKINENRCHQKQSKLF